MKLENIITNVDNKPTNAVRVELEEGVLVLKGVEYKNDNIVYTTFNGDIYKTDYNFQTKYPLLKDNQFYLDFD